jgi:hypothetical protein
MPFTISCVKKKKHSKIMLFCFHRLLLHLTSNPMYTLENVFCHCYLIILYLERCLQNFLFLFVSCKFYSPPPPNTDSEDPLNYHTCRYQCPFYVLLFLELVCPSLPSLQPLPPVLGKKFKSITHFIQL